MNMTLEEFIRRINTFLEHSKSEEVYSERFDQVHTPTMSDRRLQHMIDKAQTETRTDA
jgi:hypothetical protein